MPNLSVDTVRFLSQISHEPKNYLALQEKLFQGMTIDDIYETVKAYADKKQRISLGQGADKPPETGRSREPNTH